MANCNFSSIEEALLTGMMASYFNSVDLAHTEAFETGDDKVSGKYWNRTPYPSMEPAEAFSTNGLTAVANSIS